MTVLRVGSTQKYAENFERIFGKKKSGKNAGKTKVAGATAAKKSKKAKKAKKKTAGR